MKAYLTLTKAQLKLFARNRQMLFFSLFFPILLMVALGSFLGSGGQTVPTGFVVDEDGTFYSRALAAHLAESDVLELEQGERDEAFEAVRRGDKQLVVIIPAGHGEQLEEKVPLGEARAPVVLESGETATIELYYDEQNAVVSGLGVQLVKQIVDEVSKTETGYVPLIDVEASPAESLGLRYIDFLVPGIVAMMIMSSNLNGVAGQIASWRERGVLRRMQSTTLSAGTFIAAQITARLMLNGLQAVIVLLIAALAFGTQVRGSWAVLLFYVILGTLVFMSIGFIIAGLAKTPESAGPIAGLISFPLLFLGNVFFPVRDMPEFLQPIVLALPITPLSGALREVMNVGAGIGSLWVETVILVAWLAAAFVVASRSFKWE